MTIPAGDPSHESWWQRHERERQEQAAQIGAFFQQLSASLGGLRSALVAPPPDDVQFAGAAVVGADGTWRIKDLKTPFASIAIYNSGATTLSAVTSGAGSHVPTQGAGVAHVPGYSYRVLALRGTELTVFGTVGQTFDVEVFMRPRPPGAGQYVVAADYQAPAAVLAPNPGAGNTLTWQAPISAAMTLVAVTFTLTTSATAGTRRVTVVGVGPTNKDYFALPFTGTTGPGTTASYTAAKGLGVGSAGGMNFAALPAGPWPAGMYLRTKILSKGTSTTTTLTNVTITYRLANP